MSGRRDAGNVAVLRDTVVGPKKPESVADEEAAEIGPRFDSFPVRNPHRGKLRIAGFEPPVCRHSRGVEVSEGIPPKRIAARFREDVDHTAERPPVLGLIPAGLDFDFLNELVVERLPLECPCRPRGRVDAVDRPLVLGRRRAVNRQREDDLRVTEVGRHARIGAYDLRVVAPDRKTPDDVTGVARARRRRSPIDARRLPRNDDADFRLDPKHQVHRHDGPERQQAHLFDGPKTGKTRHDPIHSRGNRRDPIAAVTSRHHGTRPDETRAGRSRSGRRKFPDPDESVTRPAMSPVVCAK